MTTEKPAPLYLGTPQLLTVQYERKFSDGNFGSEGISLSITTTVSPDYFVEDHAAEVARALRAAVLTELSHSAATRVASAAAYELNPPSAAARPAVAGAPGFEDQPF